jgi:hypothetical protein
MCLGLIFAVARQGPVLKALTMILTGLLLSMIGSDLRDRRRAHDWGVPERPTASASSSSAWACSGSAKSCATWNSPEALRSSRPR